MSPTSSVRADIVRWRTATTDAAPSGRSVLVAASCTAHSIEPGLGVHLLDELGEQLPAISHVDYNQLFQLALDPQRFGADEADEVVVLWRIEDVFERDLLAWGNLDPEAHQRMLDGAHSLGSAIRSLAGSVAGTVTVSDAPLPCGYGFDHLDTAEFEQLSELQQSLNRALDRGLDNASVDRLRLAALQAAHGTLATFDARNWQMYRQPFTAAFAHVIGHEIGAIIARRTQPAPKVLVLDCDNTLWGGVAVDDGIGGLQASDAFPGFSYRSFQVVAQRLRHRGVLLALVSKNDPETVTTAFAQVDGMVLTDDDIAGRRVSWGPKPQAIAELADEFNLGLDSFVFVDDSPYEIGSVAEQLPAVRTLLVPEDIEELPSLLASTGWFRGIRVTGDDVERTARMQAERVRENAATEMSHDDFLASLNLRVELVEVGESELTRVVQLINKTNQFNLTTIRRSAVEVSSLVASDDSRVFAFSVDDRFGEYGIVAVVIATRESDGWLLDTVLMSCRVLGRGVESAVLSATVERLRAASDGVVAGHFVPTDRNAMVSTLLADHGFESVSAEPQRFALPAGRGIDSPAHITVVVS